MFKIRGLNAEISVTTGAGGEYKHSDSLPISWTYKGFDGAEKVTVYLCSGRCLVGYTVIASEAPIDSNLDDSSKTGGLPAYKLPDEIESREDYYVSGVAASCVGSV